MHPDAERRRTTALCRDGVVVEFPRRRSIADVCRTPTCCAARAVDGVSLDVYPRELSGWLAISGSGKTTLGRAILGLYEPSSGNVLFRGQDIAASDPDLRKVLRSQSPDGVSRDLDASLNPRMSVRYTICGALRFHNMVPPKEIPAETDRSARFGWASPEMVQTAHHVTR